MVKGYEWNAAFMNDHKDKDKDHLTRPLARLRCGVDIDRI